MPKVRVKEVYFDRVRDEYPEVGKEFEVEEKRAEVLITAGVCELVTEKQVEEPKKDALAEKPKKESKKAKAETK